MVTDVECCVGAFAVRYFVDFRHNTVLALSGINDSVCSALFREPEAFVSGIDGDKRFCELDA